MFQKQGRRVCVWFVFQSGPSRRRETTGVSHLCEDPGTPWRLWPFKWRMIFFLLAGYFKTAGDNRIPFSRNLSAIGENFFERPMRFCRSRHPSGRHGRIRHIKRIARPQDSALSKRPGVAFGDRASPFSYAKRGES